MVTFSIADHAFSVPIGFDCIVYIFTLLWTDTFVKAQIVLTNYIWREIGIFGLWHHSQIDYFQWF